MTNLTTASICRNSAWSRGSKVDRRDQMGCKKPESKASSHCLENVNPRLAHLSWHLLSCSDCLLAGDCQNWSPWSTHPIHTIKKVHLDTSLVISRRWMEWKLHTRHNSGRTQKSTFRLYDLSASWSTYIEVSPISIPFSACSFFIMGQINTRYCQIEGQGVVWTGCLARAISCTVLYLYPPLTYRIPSTPFFHLAWYLARLTTDGNQFYSSGSLGQ